MTSETRAAAPAFSLPSSWGRVALYLLAAIAVHALLAWMEHEQIWYFRIELFGSAWAFHAVFIVTMVATWRLGMAPVMLTSIAVVLAEVGWQFASAFAIYCLSAWLIARHVPRPGLRIAAIVVLSALAAAARFETFGFTVAQWLSPGAARLSFWLWGLLLVRVLLYQVERPHLEQQDQSFWKFLGSLTIMPFSGGWRLAPIPYGRLLGQYGSREWEKNVRAGLGLILLGVAYRWVYRITAQSGVLDHFRHLIEAANSGRLDAALEQTSRIELWASWLLLLPFTFLVLASHIYVVVGNLRLLGFDLGAGFNRPFLAPTFLEFWRRWNYYWRETALILFYWPTLARLRRAVSRGRAQGLAVAGVFIGLVVLRTFVDPLTSSAKLAEAVDMHEATAILLRTVCVGLLTVLSAYVWLRCRRGSAPPRRLPERAINVLVTIGALNATWILYLLVESRLGANDLTRIICYAFGS